MDLSLKPPGLISRANRNGSVRLYWRCTPDAAKMGYRPTIVPLHEIEPDAISSRCYILQAEMQQWLAHKKGAVPVQAADMRIKDLFRVYRERDSSPFQSVKWNTRRTYSQVLDTIEDAASDVKLTAINMEMLYRWYNDACYPEGKGRDKPTHLRKAHGIISMLRRVISYGAAAEIPECDRLSTILSNMRFKAPGRRTAALFAKHVVSFIDTAVANDRLSLALGTALQFELGMRQRDVIGEWEPLDGDRPTSTYVMNRRQWVNGLTWDCITPDWVLTKTTTKTGQIVTHDLTLCPMSKKLIEQIEIEKRSFGPIIIDELNNRPYAEHAYQRHWREIADKAGLPRGLWNMDARSGAATEASDAGASLGDTRMVLGHSDERTTARYVRGEGLEKTRRVAKLRLAHRQNGLEKDGENV